MLPNITEVIRPRSLEEALDILAGTDGSVQPMAGGTAKSMFKAPRIKAVLDLWPLPLRYLLAEGCSLRIGATTTIGDIVRSAAARQPAGDALTEAAARTASSPLRNLITVGGSLASLFPWSDLPAALLVLGARIHVRGLTDSAWAVEDFIQERPRKVLGSHHLLTEIEIPAAPAGSGSAFLKFAESNYSYAWASAAASVTISGGQCAECRLAIGAVEAVPHRLPEVEQFLVGQPLTDDVIRQAGQAVLSAVRPHADARSSREYRLELTGELCQRVIATARDRVLGRKEVAQ